MITGDTIAAIATAPGRSGVAVIRVSGPEALSVAERLTGRVPTVGRIAFARVSSVASQSSPASHASLASHASQSSSARLLDEAIVLAFKAPHSYTGEDVVEFQCHGGAVTPRRVLEACLSAGARLAHRGEFTQRAFLNGKLDYDQAESVLDLIDAKTARAADAALEGLSGRRRRELKSLYDAALDLSTRLEYALDVDESDLPEGFGQNLKSQILNLKSRIAEALRRAHEGKLLREGALVVLAGPPNAGKSSLMNALLKENRAIVSDRPGTTRDSIEEWMDLGGWPIRLVDTAGLREAGDAIEAEGVRRAEDLMAKADVVVWLVEELKSWGVEELKSYGGFQPLNPSTLQLINPSTLQPFNSSTLQLLPIHAKCDLGRGPGLNVSAKTGEGLEVLKQAIVERLEAKAEEGEECNTSSTDEAALHEALALLKTGLLDGKETQDEDLVLLANAVRVVAERLGASIGAVYSSDMLDNLFSRFCVGK